MSGTNQELVNRQTYADVGLASKRSATPPQVTICGVTGHIEQYNALNSPVIERYTKSTNPLIGNPLIYGLLLGIGLGGQTASPRHPHLVNIWCPHHQTGQVCPGQVSSIKKVALTLLPMTETIQPRRLPILVRPRHPQH